MSKADKIYSAFGLVIASEIELISLEPTRLDRADVTPDVTVRLASLTAPLGPPSYLGMTVACTSDGLVLDVPPAGVLRISGGRLIEASPHDEGRPETLAEYILGTGFGAILHQRGRLPLHANAFVCEERAFAFTGRSGAGKSTLAAHLQARGYELLTDDLCALTLEPDGRVLAWPGIPRIKLWRDAADRLNIPSDVLRPLSWTVDKFEIGASRSSAAGPAPLAAVFDLQVEGPDRLSGVRSLSGIAAVNVIVANTYRRRLVDFQGVGDRFLRQVAQIVGKVSVYELNRRWGVENISDGLISIEEKIRAELERAH